MFNIIANAMNIATRTENLQQNHQSEFYNHEARKREELHRQQVLNRFFMPTSASNIR